MNPKLNSNVENFNSKYSEDWLTVRQIMNGMIQLENGEIISGIKIAPKNIFIMDNVSQNNVISRLQNFYNSLDYEFWLIIADRPVDISVYLSRLQIMYKNAQDNVTRKLTLQDMNKANLFMSAEYNVVDTEYFILFKEKRMELVQKKLHNLISGLANCAIQSTQASNEDLRMILDNFLNDGTKTTVGTVM